MSATSFVDTSGFNWRHSSNFIIIQSLQPSNSKLKKPHSKIELNCIHEDGTENNPKSLSPIFVNLNYRTESGNCKLETDKSTELKIKNPANKLKTISQKALEQTIADSNEIKSLASKRNQKNNKYRIHSEGKQVKHSLIPQMNCVYNYQTNLGSYKVSQPKSLPLEPLEKKKKMLLKGSLKKPQTAPIDGGDHFKPAINNLRNIPQNKANNDTLPTQLAKANFLENDRKCSQLLDSLRKFVATVLTSQASELAAENIYSKLISKFQCKTTVSSMCLVDKIDQLLEILTQQRQNEEKFLLDVMSLFLDM